MYTSLPQDFISYGLAALIFSYNEAVTNPWQLTQAIFGDLYQHMIAAKENMKETVLVAIGSIGK